MTSLRRGCSTAIAAFLLACFGSANPAFGATIPVACNEAGLIAAIETANSSTGPDTLELAAGCEYSYSTPYSANTGQSYWYGPSALPAIASDVTIAGNGATIRRDATTVPFRLFFVGADPTDPDTLDYATPGAGVLTLRAVTLRGGLARGGNSAIGGGGAGMGGAIFSQGEVTLSRTTVAESSARGGSSGTSGLGVGGGGIGSDATANDGGGFGGGTGFGGGSGGSGGGGLGGGGGGGFRASDDGSNASTTAGANGGGPATGLGGPGRLGGAGGNGSGGGGGSAAGNAGGAGGGFGAGGVSGGFASGGGGGGGVGGGGAGPWAAGGGGGFGGGGGYGDDGGGTGGFGGGGGGGGGGDPGGTGGFGGGAGSSSANGGGGAGMGGAIFNHQGELTIQNSTLSQNSALGGGVWLGGGAQTGSGLGGAIFNLNGALTLDSATVAFNTANAGGAIYNLGYLANDAGAPGGHSYMAEATLTNSILSDSTGAAADLLANSPATVSGGVTNITPSNADASDPNVVESRTIDGTASFSGAPITADPGLDAVLASNGGLTPTHSIAATSPAFEAGATGLATDQRDVTRPQGTADDIGAFELQVASVSLTTSSSPDIVLGGQAHDTATLAGGSSPTGTITFRLFGPDDANCSGPAVFTDTKPVAGNGDYISASYTPTQSGTYRWIASYSGDANNGSPSGACNDPNETFTVTRAQRSLTVATTGSGSGFVDSAPAGIDCGTNVDAHADCAQDYPDGTSVTLTAHPAEGTDFAGFTGDCADAGPSCTTTMDRARSVTATFSLAPTPSPTPSPDPDPTLTPDYDADQGLGRTVSLSASCDRPCSVVASGKLKTVVERGGNRIRSIYTVRRDGIKLNSTGETARLELTLTEKAMKKARTALDSGGSARVTGVITATDDFFNVTKQRFAIDLE